MKKPFLNTMLAAWLKVFITAVLVQYMSIGKSVFELDRSILETIFNAGLTALIPVIINALNPDDPRYGYTKKEDAPPVDK